MIDRPSRPPVQDHGRKNAATLAALLLVLACAAALFFLVALIIPGLLAILLIGLVFVPMTLMHYLVWGRLMQQYHQQSEDENSANDA